MFFFPPQREADEKAKAEAELAERLRIKDTTKEEFKPNSNYREKYERLIGKESAVQAAKPTTTNKQYGFGKHLDRIAVS